MVLAACQFVPGKFFQASLMFEVRLTRQPLVWRVFCKIVEDVMVLEIVRSYLQILKNFKCHN